MSRDHNLALSEAKKMVDLITTSAKELSSKERETIAKDTVNNWANYYNKGIFRILHICDSIRGTRCNGMGGARFQAF